MDMLSEDRDTFYHSPKFVEAVEFLQDAHVRAMCYSICDTYFGHDDDKIERFKDLLDCPACQECWFIDMLKIKCTNSEIQKAIVDAGL